MIQPPFDGCETLHRAEQLFSGRAVGPSRPCRPDGSESRSLCAPKGGIEFRHLNFRYPDGEYDVLRDISFTIAPGESVGIVGKTGAGKTALVDLLLRTYNVPDGTLFVPPPSRCGEQ